MVWRSRTRTVYPNCFERYAPSARACGRCGRVRDQKTLAEMMADGETVQSYLTWLWPAIGVGVLLFIALLVAKSQPARISSPTIAVHTLSAAERAQEAEQKARDAKFWAAKEKREAAEMADYHAPHQIPTGTTQASDTPVFPEGADPSGGAVLGAKIDLHTAPHNSPTGGEGPNPHSGQLQGTGGVSAM